MVAASWGGEVVVVVALTHIRAAPMTSMALRLVRVSPDMAVVIDVELCLFLGARLAGTELSSFNEAGYGVQLMGRLRSDYEELFEALEDMRELEDGDGSSLQRSLLLNNIFELWWGVDDGIVALGHVHVQRCLLTPKCHVLQSNLFTIRDSGALCPARFFWSLESSQLYILLLHQ